eukprot:m.4744 g.4744  ORF g.4744 m.4744 type:complete len:349 (+) comp3081_c0_seq1:78-1124(+)
MRELKEEQRKAKLAFFQVSTDNSKQINPKTQSEILPQGLCRVHAVFEGHQGAVTAVSFHPDGNLLASSSHDKTTCLWDVHSETLLSRFTSLCEQPIWSASFSSDGTVYAIGTGAGLVELWSPKTDKPRLLHSFKAHGSYVEASAFNGLKLATGGDDTKIRIWKLLPADKMKEKRRLSGTEWKPEPPPIKLEQQSPSPPRSLSPEANLNSLYRKLKHEVEGMVLPGDVISLLRQLRDSRQKELDHERRAAKALHIALSARRKELEALKAQTPKLTDAAISRKERGLPLWGLQQQSDPSNDGQYLAQLRRRRAELYSKIGRADLGDKRTYLETFEMHPGDLERQAYLLRI